MAQDPVTLVAGGCYRFRLTATKDGAAWDLTNATVTLYLKDPTGVVSMHTASVQSPATAGVAYYDNATSDLTLVGDWQKAWSILDGTVVGRTEPEDFCVVAFLI